MKTHKNERYGMRYLVVLLFIVSGCVVFISRHSIISDILDGKNKCICWGESDSISNDSNSKKHLGYIYLDLFNQFDDMLSIYVDDKYYCWRYFYTEKSTSSTLCIIRVPFDMRVNKTISIRDIRGRELYRIEVSKDLEGSTFMKGETRVVLGVWRWHGEWRHEYSDHFIPVW